MCIRDRHNVTSVHKDLCAKDHKPPSYGALVRGGRSERVRGATGVVLFTGLASKSVGQLFIHIATVADGHQADDSSFLLNGIDDAKAANAIFS